MADVVTITGEQRDRILVYGTLEAAVSPLGRAEAFHFGS